MRRFRRKRRHHRERSGHAPQQRPPHILARNFPRSLGRLRQHRLHHLSGKRDDSPGALWALGKTSHAMTILFRAICISFLVRVCIGAAPNYLPVGIALDQFIEREMRDKGINGVAIALVDDQNIVWSRGYGVARPDKIPSGEDVPPTGVAMRDNTPVRAGSVSKLFTSILIMREVEAGHLDLDAPITKYLPDFHPTNRFNKPITLRQILAHRSGVVREPPYGNYFETNQTSLARMVESLNDTEIIYEPGERTKYSNAAIATAGYIAAESARKNFPTLARDSIFKPLRMDETSFNV